MQRELASNVDLVPTLVEVAGVPMRPTIQGHSLAGLFDGTPGPDRDRAFAEISYQDYYHLRRCIRTDRHKLIFLLHRGGDPHPADRRGGLVHDPVTPDRVANAFHPMAELFDLDEDPEELDNVIDGRRTGRCATSCSAASTCGCAMPVTRSWTERSPRRCTAERCACWKRRAAVAAREA